MGSHQRLWCEGKTYGEQSVGDEATEVQRGGTAVCGQMEALPHHARALWRSDCVRLGVSSWLCCSLPWVQGSAADESMA